MKDYLGTGGGIDSGKSLNNAGLIHEGDCSRTVEGTGEDLAKRLHLSKSLFFFFFSAAIASLLTGLFVHRKRWRIRHNLWFFQVHQDSLRRLSSLRNLSLLINRN